MPEDVRDRAREAYRRFVEHPGHPALRFKKLHATLPVWSVRITDSDRAVGVRRDEGSIVWFFIGTHDEYERLLRSL